MAEKKLRKLIREMVKYTIKRKESKYNIPQLEKTSKKFYDDLEKYMPKAIKNLEKSGFYVEKVEDNSIYINKNKSSGDGSVLHTNYISTEGKGNYMIIKPNSIIDLGKMKSLK